MLISKPLHNSTILMTAAAAAENKSMKWTAIATNLVIWRFSHTFSTNSNTARIKANSQLKMHWIVISTCRAKH